MRLLDGFRGRHKSEQDEMREVHKKRDVKKHIKMLQNRERFSPADRKRAAGHLMQWATEYQRMRGLGLIRTITEEEYNHITEVLYDVALRDPDVNVASHAKRQLYIIYNVPLDQRV